DGGGIAAVSAFRTDDRDFPIVEILLRQSADTIVGRAELQNDATLSDGSHGCQQRGKGAGGFNHNVKPTGRVFFKDDFFPLGILFNIAGKVGPNLRGNSKPVVPGSNDPNLSARE